MQLDHSLDYLVTDNLESVTLRSRRNSGDMLDTLLDGVLREEISAREASASFGAFAPGDCWFCLPQAILLNGPPKPGDHLVDQTAADFTLLEVFGRLRDGSGQYQEWRCRGRQLALAYDLSDFITIEQPTVTLDAAGVAVRAWSPFVTGYQAKVVDKQQSQVDLLGIRGLLGDYAVILSGELAITREMRVVWPAAPSGYLEVVGYTPAAQLDQLPVIAAKAMP